MENISFSHGALQTWWKNAKGKDNLEQPKLQHRGRLKGIVLEPLIPLLVYFLFSKFKIQQSFVNKVFSWAE